MDKIWLLSRLFLKDLTVAKIYAKDFEASERQAGRQAGRQVGTFAVITNSNLTEAF